MGLIIADFGDFSIDGLDDIYKIHILILVEITMNFAFYTFGCKVNQYETQAMEQLLTAQGHTVVPFDQKADGYIINTCSVTAIADRKNRTLIRRCRRENPEAIIGVCGCYPQHDAAAVEALGADVVGGSACREEFLQMMLSALGSREKQQHIDKALARRTFEVLPAGGLSERTRAMLKVQDGCCNFCTYCIIPYTRGPVRSAPPELAVQQAKELAQKGYREIVVTGIEIASWGVDLPGKPSLAMLIDALCSAAAQMRVRLGSLEPRIITEDFCAVLQRHKNLCPQFHLSLQSGSDGVLARMKRKYDTARYYESVQLLRRFFPDCAITTDLIVAFPGETEEEFAQSLAFIEKCAFADMHIFPYSRRPGTPADKMPGQHDNATKESRSRLAIATAQKTREGFLQSMAGTVQSVLFEEMWGEYAVGYTPNYIKVYLPGCDRHNTVVSVRLTACFRDGMLAETIDN